MAAALRPDLMKGTVAGNEQRPDLMVPRQGAWPRQMRLTIGSRIRARRNEISKLPIATLAALIVGIRAAGAESQPTQCLRFRC